MSAAIILPIVGILIAGLVGSVLPWASSNGDSANLWEIMDALNEGASPEKFGPVYASGWWIVVLIGAGMMAFAGTLDSAGWRWLHAATLIFCLALGGAAGGVALVITALPHDGDQPWAWAVAAGAALLGIVLGSIPGWILGMLNGVAYRVIAGLALLAAGFLHAVAVIDLFGDADPEPGAFVASFGYLLCAVGCFIGPRYIPIYQAAKARRR